MKKFAALVVASAVLSLGVSGAFAQQRPSAPPAAEKPEKADKSSVGARETWKNTQGLHESSALIGTRIKNAQGKDIGEIDQLLIDPKDGKVTHAVVGVGGFLGIAEKHLIVTWPEVKLAADPRNPNKIVASMDQATLEKAPRYEKRMASMERERTSPAASPALTPAPEPKKDAEPKRTDDKK